MARLRQKTSILKRVAEFMAKEGKVFGKIDYIQSEGTPVRYHFIHSYFGSWGRMLAMLELQEPELFKQAKAGKVEEPKAKVVKDTPVKTPTKPAPKAI